MKKYTLILVVSVSVFLWSCSTRNKDLTTDVGTLAEGKALMADDFYEEARKQFFRVKTDFPQSSLQVEADLLIAQSYYQEESYETAAKSFEEFIRTYPGRSEIPEALYQLGMCYVNEMPATAQRDTRPTAKVVDTFTRLMVDYPENKHQEEIQKHISEARDQLAQKIFQIAQFYEKKNYYESAARRYGEVLDQYPQHPLAQESMARQIYMLRKAGKADRANDLATAFEEKFPNSKFKSMIQP